MLTTIAEFRRQVDTDIGGLVDDLQRLTGRYGAEEQAAWRASYTRISQLFGAPSVQPLHLFMAGRGHLSCEYQLPAASSWCDIVLLGAHEQRASAVVLELKHWQTRSDRAGLSEGLMLRRGAPALHPSDQVRGYVEYCRRFHSAISSNQADVHGCAVMTADRWLDAYRQPPNHTLVEQFPVFSTEDSDSAESFGRFLAERLSNPDAAFAEAFERGTYRQNRGFVAQIGAQILDPAASVFTLLDGQRQAFAECRGVVENTIFAKGSKRPAKRVVIVHGPPGSGKSVVAAKLWASLVTDKRLPAGNAVIVTTSLSQATNWSHLFVKASGQKGARFALRKASSYSPLTTAAVNEVRRRFGEEFISDATDWRENLLRLEKMGWPFRDGANEDEVLVSIVDEAQALINPEHAEGRGNFGFAMTLGPLGYHVIRSSVLSVFLLDARQAFRSRENSSVEDLRAWSRELGAGDPIEISLDGLQFRCAGSAEYVNWVEELLPASRDSKSTAVLGVPRSRPQKKAAAGWAMDVQVFDQPDRWEAALQSHVDSGGNVRLLASYSRRWTTEKFANAHEAPERGRDFVIPWVRDGKLATWSRIWNVITLADYKYFVAAPAGSALQRYGMLSEVGCPVAVRGFDFDYVGLIWLDDLVYRDGRWLADPGTVFESGIANLTGKAKRERVANPLGPRRAELLTRVSQAYRILLTRGIRGAYLWIPDQETREYVQGTLAGVATCV